MIAQGFASDNEAVRHQITSIDVMCESGRIQNGAVVYRQVMERTQFPSEESPEQVRPLQFPLDRDILC